MSLLVKQITINPPTTNAESLADDPVYIGFKPAAVIIQSIGLRNSGNPLDGTIYAMDEIRAFGWGFFATSTSTSMNLASIGWYQDYNVGTSSTRNAVDYGDYVLGTSSSNPVCELSQLDYSDGYITPVWTSNRYSTERYQCLFIGGDDVQAFSSSFTAKTVSPGAQTITNTNMGFTPDVVLFISAGNTSSGGGVNYTHIENSIGMADAKLNQGYISFYSRNGVSPTQEGTRQITNKALGFTLATSGGPEWEFSVTQFKKNQMDLYWNDHSPSADRIYYLALKCSGFEVGNNTADTSVSSKKISSAGTPRGILAFSNNEIASSSTRTDRRKLTIGMSDGYRGANIWSGSSDNVTPSVTKVSQLDNTTELLRSASTTSGLVSQIEVGKFESDGINLNTTLADGTAWQYLYLLLGTTERKTVSIAEQAVTKGVWEFRLADSDTFEDLYIIQNAANKKVSFVLNNPGSASFDLHINDEVANYIKPLEHCIKAYRDGILRWSGPVWAIRDDVPNNKTSVNCVGWLELLNKKLVKRKLFFENEDAGIIAKLVYLNSLDFVLSNIQLKNPYMSVEDGVEPTKPDYWELNPNYSPQSGPSYEPYSGSHYNVYAYNTTYPNTGTQAGLLAIYNDNKVFSSKKLYALQGVIKTRAATYTGYHGNKHTVKLGEYSSSNFTSNSEYTDYHLEPWSGVTTNYISGLIPLSLTRPEFLTSWSPSVDVNSTNVRAGFETLTYTSTAGCSSSASNIEVGSIETIETYYDIPVQVGSVEYSQYRRKEVEKFSVVGNIIKELSEMESGFDYEVDPITRELNIYRYIGSDNGVQFGYGWGPENIAEFSRSIETAPMSNRIYVQGKYASGSTQDDTQIAKYGILEEVIPASDIVDSNILGAFANAELVYKAAPKEIYSFTPMSTAGPNIPEPFIDYNLGDTIYININRGRLNISKTPVRLFSFTVDIDNNNIEKISDIQTSLG